MAFWPTRYVFLFSHMRSYSSVLSHVLGAHPEVAGYAESQLRYRRKRDLAMLRVRIARALGGWPSGRYLLDKLLHNYMLIPRQLRGSDRLRALIFLREPQPTLRSISRLLSADPGAPWYADPEAVATYYCERLTWISAVGVLLRERALAFPAEAIVRRTPEVLARIQDHLGLDVPLRPDYPVRRYTGLAIHGDMSPNIRAGRILQHPEPAPAPVSDDLFVRLSPEMRRRCEVTYQRSVILLADWCPSFGFLATPAGESRVRTRAADSSRRPAPV